MANALESSENNYIYKISTLFGKRDDPLLYVYARQIIEMISHTSKKPLILAVSLQNEGRGVDFLQISLNKLQNMRMW